MKKLTLQCNNHVASFSSEEATNPEESKDRLTDEPLNIPSDVYTFKYDYPLSVEVGIPHRIGPKTSIIGVLLLAQIDYKYIYASEEAAVGHPGHITGMLNRRESAGPYGIWGHDLSDLYFESVEIDIEKKIVTFGIGS